MGKRCLIIPPGQHKQIGWCTSLPHSSKVQRPAGVIAGFIAVEQIVKTSTKEPNWCTLTAGDPWLLSRSGKAKNRIGDLSSTKVSWIWHQALKVTGEAHTSHDVDVPTVLTDSIGLERGSSCWLSATVQDDILASLRSQAHDQPIDCTIVARLVCEHYKLERQQLKPMARDYSGVVEYINDMIVANPTNFQFFYFRFAHLARLIDSTTQKLVTNALRSNTSSSSNASSASKKKGKQLTQPERSTDRGGWLLSDHALRVEIEKDNARRATEEANRKAEEIENLGSSQLTS